MCRSFLSPFQDSNGNFYVKGRGNGGVATVNLVRIAIKNAKNEEGFYKELDKISELCKLELISRYKYLSKVKCSSNPLFYLEGGMRHPDGITPNPDDTIESFLKSYTWSLGYVGLNEACSALYGKIPHADKEVYEKSLKIIQYLKDKCLSWKDETGLLFGLYGTPAESLVYRMNKRDKEDFGVIPYVTDKKYYTNSFHLPVWINTDPYEKIDFEVPYCEISNSGNISYGEYPNMQNNIEALIECVDYAMDKGIYYYGINTPSDTCFTCGFEGEIKIDKFGEYECPSCKEKNLDKMNIIRRVCGYLARAERSNDGKMQEYKDRVKHIKEKYNGLSDDKVSDILEKVKELNEISDSKMDDILENIKDNI